MSSADELHLSWTGEDDAFRGGRAGGPEIVLDGDGGAGPSPTDALLLSVAACMAADIRHILQKGRVPLEALTASVRGRRAKDPPRRFEAVRILFRVDGPGEDDRSRVERALRLSRETYCSVLHTLRSDLELDLSVRLS